jgi:hypothetical protein
VWDAVVTLETDAEEGHVVDASGFVYRHIDLDTERPPLDEGQALDLCLQYHGDEDFKDIVSSVKVSSK